MPQPRRTTITTKAPQLPPELWMNIAEYIESDELVGYMGVHRVFYEQVMDMRYSELELKHLQPSALFKVIDNLKNPDVAKRVITLTIWPVAVQTAIKDVPRSEEPYPLLTKIVNLLRRFGARRRERTVSRERAATIQGRYRSVEDAGRGLTGVENVNLHWFGPDQVDMNLFAAIRPVFGSNLRSLVVDIPLMAFANAHTYLAGIDRLEELELALSVDRAGGEFKENHRNAITKTLIPFINRAAPSLQVLSMTIKNHVELSPLFHGLGYFPKLHRLMLNLPFDLHHIHDPSGFNRLLVRHRDLKELYISHLSCCKSHEVPTEPDWVRRCFLNVDFTDLKTLSLGLTSAFHLKFARHMKPLTQSLSSLILTGPNLRYADAESVLTAIAPPQLSSLSLFVETLTPQLVALLAEKCPDLQRLDLDIVQSRRAEGADGPHDEPGFIHGLDGDEIYRRPLYNAWKLRRLTIHMWVYTLGRREQPALMSAIVKNVPSLQNPT